MDYFISNKLSHLIITSFADILLLEGYFMEAHVQANIDETTKEHDI